MRREGTGPRTTALITGATSGVVVHEIPQEALGRIIELVETYGDRPMDLADATLVVAAEALGVQEIVSLDRDFEIYRIAGRARFVNPYATSE